LSPLTETGGMIWILFRDTDELRIEHGTTI
jgi:hypothetical protein